MWQLWFVSLFPLSAFQGVEQDSKGGSDRSLQEFQDELIRNKTVPENETNTLWKSKWVVSTTTLPMTMQSNTDYKARILMAPTITIRAKDRTCHILLSCAIAKEEGGNLTFAWHQANSSVVLSTAPTLNITKRPQQGTLDYICTVRNQAGENSSMVSLKKYCHDPGLSASFYAKYVVPLLIVLVILLVLFLMYRRKRGKEIHSSTESINESSDSDSGMCPSVEQTAEVSFLHEATKPLSEDSESIAEAAAAAAGSTEESVSHTPKQLPTQA